MCFSARLARVHLHIQGFELKFLKKSLSNLHHKSIGSPLFATKSVELSQSGMKDIWNLNKPIVIPTDVRHWAILKGQGRGKSGGQRWPDLYTCVGIDRGHMALELVSIIPDPRAAFAAMTPERIASGIWRQFQGWRGAMLWHYTELGEAGAIPDRAVPCLAMIFYSGPLVP